MNMSLDVLAFGAHPDDIEIGCGGSLILAADKGLITGVADLTHAELSTRGTVDKRKDETSEATKIIGLSNRWTLGLPDAHIGTDANHVLPIICWCGKSRRGRSASPNENILLYAIASLRTIFCVGYFGRLESEIGCYRSIYEPISVWWKGSKNSNQPTGLYAIY
jgi:LmbE family N-acetylglucosaminyl deacetylase